MQLPCLVHKGKQARRSAGKAGGSHAASYKRCSTALAVGARLWAQASRRAHALACIMQYRKRTRHDQPCSYQKLAWQSLTVLHYQPRASTPQDRMGYSPGGHGSPLTKPPEKARGAGNVTRTGCVRVGRAAVMLRCRIHTDLLLACTCAAPGLCTLGWHWRCRVRGAHLQSSPDSLYETAVCAKPQFIVE